MTWFNNLDSYLTHNKENKIMKDNVIGYIIYSKSIVGNAQ